jgi:branched-chain amino acid transport system permease protein
VSQDPVAERGHRSVFSTKATKRSAIFLVVVLAALVPHMTGDPYYLSVAYQAEMLISLAIGLNIVVGYAGLLDLGFAAFFAIGAYTTAILSATYHWTILATIVPGILLAVVCAVIIGLPTLRLRSDYLAVVTLGFGLIIQTIANNLTVTGGPTGIYGIPALTIGSILVQSAAAYYYLFLILVILFVFLSLRLRNSRIGRAWLCIREDEDTAQAMGIKIHRYKLYAYMGGAVIGSVTGAFYAPALTAISPPSFGFNESLLILMAVAIGGMGSVWGSILGGAVVVILPEAFRQFSQARFLVFGALLIILMMTRPQGLLPEGAFQGTMKRLRARFNGRSTGPLIPPEAMVREAPPGGTQ